MSETQTPSNEDFMRAFVELQRKVADISNSSVGKQFTTGDLIPGIGTTRTGALLCDGTTYNRVDYAALSALCITIPALIGDGSTTFTVPDYRGQALAGAGGSFTLGTATGSASVTLTAAQSGQPAIAAGTTGAGTAHTHTGTAAAGAVAVPTAAPTTNVATAGSGGYNFTVTLASESAHTHATPAVAAANASASHTNVQPTLPANIFIVT